MRDVVCEQCGEPWEFYYLTQELAENRKQHVLQGRGCPACDWGENERATGDYRLERIQSIEQNTGLDTVRYF